MFNAIDLAVALFSLSLILTFAMLVQRARCTREVQWDELVFRLRPSDRPGVAEIADGYLQPHEKHVQLEGNAMFEMLGGTSGLNAIYQNSKVILALAGYATRWNLEEGTMVTEQIRRDALRLQRTILIVRLETALKNRFRFVSGSARRVPFQLEEAAALYQQMTVRLLVLYQGSHAGLYPQLRAVLLVC